MKESNTDINGSPVREMLYCLLWRGNTEMYSDVKAIMESLKPDDDISTTLQMDSLDGVEFSMRIEECYGFKIEDDEFVALKTIRDVESFVERRLVELRST